MAAKRPVSLSDSNIYIGNYSIESINDFHVRSKPLIEAPAPAPAPDPKEELVNFDKYLEISVDYTLRFAFHIFLISIFEVIFYFKFVSKDEDNGILGATNYYTSSIIKSCRGLNKNETALINSVLEKFINSSQVLATGYAASVQRSSINDSIYQLSLSYIWILASIQVLLFLVCYFKKFKLAWSSIIGENLALVIFLGLYELMFFETIIKKYQAETPQEISALFVRSLQQTCGLLT
jgi:hypothetical protein